MVTSDVRQPDKVGIRHLVVDRQTDSLTDLIGDWGNVGNKTIEDLVQRGRGATAAPAAAPTAGAGRAKAEVLDTADICNFGSDVGVRSGGRGAEETEGEGGEDSEAERAHGEWIRSVGVKRVTWVERRRRVRLSR